MPDGLYCDCSGAVNFDGDRYGTSCCVSVAPECPTRNQPDHGLANLLWLQLANGVNTWRKDIATKKIVSAFACTVAHATLVFRKLSFT